MSDIEELFLQLLQVAISNRACLSHSPTDVEWKALYAMAKKQSLLGICFAGVQRLPESMRPQEILYLTWIGVANKIQQRNYVVNRQCRDLYDRFKDYGIDSCILKGQGIGALYGSLANLRQAGDIDIFTNLNDLNSIEFARRFCNQRPEFSYKHVHLHFFEDTEVDMHFRLGLNRNLIANRKLQKWSEMLKESPFFYHDNLGYCTLSKLDSAVFTLFHIYEHFMAYGVGLRQVLDMYFVITDIGQDKECKEQIISLIENLGLIKFARALMWVLSEIFFVPEHLLLCTTDKKEGQFLLYEIMQAGNFGHHDIRNKIHEKSGYAGVKERCSHYFRLIKHYPMEVFWIPFGTMYFKYWKRKTTYKLNSKTQTKL